MLFGQTPKNNQLFLFSTSLVVVNLIFKNLWLFVEKRKKKNVKGKWELKSIRLVAKNSELEENFFVCFQKT